MKYVQINTVSHGSTGSVMFQTQAARVAEGDECWAMWGRGRAAENDHEFNFGSSFGTYADAALTRIGDRAGFHSKAATRRLLAKLDEVDPDIVHLHNLHGYYLNIEMLFGWLAGHRCQVLWTLHDCWAFTGHCSHFTYVGCGKWKTSCSDCPQKGEYPKSVLRDASARNFADKKRIFTQLSAERLTLITPSRWLANLVGESFLAKYPIEVRHNEIDRSVFKPTPSDFRERYGIGDRFMILGVASPWTERKGFGDFVKLRGELDDSFAIVMVGLSKKQIAALPAGIIGIERIDGVGEMAKVYTAADVLFNPSREETYGLTIAEAAACGTRSVVYGGGACEETARLFAGNCVTDSHAVCELLALRETC